jgi:hypothetical protein
MYKYYFILGKDFFSSLFHPLILDFSYSFFRRYGFWGPSFFPERKGRVEAGGGGQVVSFADVGRREEGEGSVRCGGGGVPTSSCRKVEVHTIP